MQASSWTQQRTKKWISDNGNVKKCGVGSTHHKGNLSPCGTRGWREGGRLVFICFHFIPLPSISLISFSGPLAAHLTITTAVAWNSIQNRILVHHSCGILNFNQTHTDSLTIMDLKSHTGYLLCNDHHRPVRRKKKRNVNRKHDKEAQNFTQNGIFLPCESAEYIP